MRSLPPPVKKALLVSGLLHLGLFVLLQILLVQKGGSPVLPDNTSPALSVRIRHLSTEHITTAAPEPVPAPEPMPEPAPVTTQPAEIADTEAVFGLEVLAPPLYIPAGELSERPRVIRDIPADASRLLSQHPEGAVIMRLHINEAGTVDEVVIEETNVAVGDLQILMSMFRKTVFSPGIMNGKAVKSELRIEVVVEPQILTIPKNRLKP